MNKHLELCVEFQRTRKLIIYEHNTPFSAFKTILKERFSIINKEIKLVDVKKNAEITSVYSFKEDNDIKVELLGESFPILSESNELPSNEIESKQLIGYTSYNQLIKKTFREEDLLFQLNQWATPQKFKLYYSEGTKKIKNGTKRTLTCSVSTCNYLIILRTSKESNNYKLYEKFFQKYSLHSNFYFQDNL